MFNFQLMLTEEESGKLVLRLPSSFRFTFAAIGAILVVAMATSGGISVVPAIIVAICLGAFLFDERWSFDLNDSSIVHRVGMTGLGKNTTFSIEEISEFNISGYKPEPEQDASFLKRRNFSTGLIRLGFTTRDGRTQTVEIRKNRHSQTLMDNALRLSEYCGKPLKQE